MLLTLPCQKGSAELIWDLNLSGEYLTPALFSKCKEYSIYRRYNLCIFREILFINLAYEELVPCMAE